MTEAEVPERRRYAKPYVVPVRVDLLTGPTTGVVSLPRHLDWSGRATYDLDSPGRIVDLYRTVIIEATNADDLYAFLDAGTLKRLWPYLWLPPRVRNLWEERFPELAQLSRLAAA